MTGPDVGLDVDEPDRDAGVPLPPNAVLRAWRRCTALPFGGERVFSRVFALKTPYAASIRPRFISVEPNRVSLLVPDRRAVRNHIGSIHATALCTGLETAVGTLAEASVPAHKRWIPRGMEVSYPARASGDITCIAVTRAEVWSSPDPDVRVTVFGLREDGAVAIEGFVRLWVTDRQ
jgi:acyl-coenzyme A thioesterase PaaI-like protein